MNGIRIIVIILLIVSAFWADSILSSVQESSLPSTYPRLMESFKAFSSQDLQLDEGRRFELAELANWIAEELNTSGKASVTFICTHNSRRSHMAQLWAAAAAHELGIEGVRTFSGGTESTAMNSRTVAALQRAGFKIKHTGLGDENPEYAVSWNPDMQPITCFSKTYAHSSNPQSQFAAIMTCSDADQGCPLVHGAAARFAIPYLDPKISDGLPEESATYDARSAQIGAEMYFLMAQVREQVTKH